VIVLMTIVGTLFAWGASTAFASPTSGRMAEMRRDGCCCREIPAGGCCCEPAVAPADASAVTKATSAIGVLSRASVRLHSSPPGSTCQCRSTSPVVPITPPDEPGGGRRHDSAGAAVEWGFIQGRIDEAPGHPSIVLRAIHAESPIYLRTSRLLI
jgi:hypothetical protein